MLGSSPFWPAAVVSDARSAVKSARQPQAAAEARKAAVATTLVHVRARIPVVRAAAASPYGNHIFLGFESGEVFCYRPARGEVVPVSGEGSAVLSLAAGEDGEAVVILRRVEEGFGHLSSLVTTATGFREVASLTKVLGIDAWLCPILVGVDERLAGLLDAGQAELLDCSCLLPAQAWLSRAGHPYDPPQPSAGFLVRGLHGLASTISVVAFDRGDVLSICRDPHVQREERKPVGWEPCIPTGSTFYNPPLTWLQTGRGLEVAGTNSDGWLCWSALEFLEGNLAITTTIAPGGPYLAAALGREDWVAGVTAQTVRWLRRGIQGFRTVAEREFALPTPVACFPHYRSNELIVVCANGTLARLACLW